LHKPSSKKLFGSIHPVSPAEIYHIRNIRTIKNRWFVKPMMPLIPAGGPISSEEISVLSLVPVSEITSGYMLWHYRFCCTVVNRYEENQPVCVRIFVDK
jgi:hypothetical protein